MHRKHPYELYLAIGDVDHTPTKAKSTQTNGLAVEHLHKTMLNEFYPTAFRKKIYHSIGELQADRDAWVREYNAERPHQGRWCYGKTPMQTFFDSLELARKSDLRPKSAAVKPSDTLRRDHPPTVRRSLGLYSLDVSGTPHAIKPYFKSDPLSRNRIDIITRLMRSVLSAAHPRYSFSVLDIRRRRLHTIVPPAGLDAILTAEMAYIESLWPNV